MKCTQIKDNCTTIQKIFIQGKRISGLAFIRLDHYVVQTYIVPIFCFCFIRYELKTLFSFVFRSPLPQPCLPSLIQTLSIQVKLASSLPTHSMSLWLILFFILRFKFLPRGSQTFCISTLSKYFQNFCDPKCYKLHQI